MHDITITNGKAEMAFVGETPWHKLGQRVNEGASIEEWRTAARLEWQALQSQCNYAKADGSRGTVADKKVLYRSDTGDALSVVGDGYQVVQPGEVLEFFRDLAAAGDWHIHTAGSLRGGRKIWALARNHTEGQVTPGDTVRGNLLLATSLDGSMRTIACMTAIRVVCANTLRLALSNAQDVIGTSHRSVFDPSDVKRRLGVARSSFDVFMDQARQLAERGISANAAQEFVRTLLRAPAAVGSIRAARGEDRILSLFAGAGRGADHDGVKGTRWGLFNAITEYVDHERGSDANRLDSAWFGAGHDIKAKALETLLA